MCLKIILIQMLRLTRRFIENTYRLIQLGFKNENNYYAVEFLLRRILPEIFFFSFSSLNVLRRKLDDIRCREGRCLQRVGVTVFTYLCSYAMSVQEIGIST